MRSARFLSCVGLAIACAAGCSPEENGAGGGAAERHDQALYGRRITYDGSSRGQRYVTLEPRGQEVLSGIQVRSGSFLDSIRLRYRDVYTEAQRWTSWAGATGGTEQTEFLMQPGETLLRVEYRIGIPYFTWITFVTTKADGGTRSYGPFGGGGGNPYTFETGSADGGRRQIQGLEVANNNLGSINELGFIDFSPCSSCGPVPDAQTRLVTYGSAASGLQSASLRAAYAERLTGVQLRSSDVPKAVRLQFTYGNNTKRWTDWVGGDGGTEQPQLLFPNAELQTMSGRLTDTGLTYLAFSTTDGRSTSGGTASGSSFSYGPQVHGGLRRVITGLDVTYAGGLAALSVVDDYGLWCNHLATVEGEPMVPSCDPCVSQIINIDNYCGNVWWDAACVRNVKRVCQRRAPDEFGFGVPTNSMQYDFDGDGKADLTYRDPSGVFYVLKSFSHTVLASQWGGAQHIPVPGDYDGDHRTDMAVFLPSDGTWHVRPTGPGTPYYLQFGDRSDVPVPGDYDGDGKTDIAVYRPSNNTWYVKSSMPNTADIVIPWGANGAIPVPGDYAGDARTDVAYVLPTTNQWFIHPTGGGADIIRQLGQKGDILVPGAYNGSKVDPAVFRPATGTWLIGSTSSPTNRTFQFGKYSDLPVVGNRLGGAKFDLTIYRPSEGNWYVRNIEDPTTPDDVTQWGSAVDNPL